MTTDEMRELASMVPEDWGRALVETAAELAHLRGLRIGKFDGLIAFGRDKYGDADFRASMGIALLSREEMNALRQMIPVGIAEVERIWRDHGPPSKEMAQGAASLRQRDMDEKRTEPGK